MKILGLPAPVDHSSLLGENTCEAVTIERVSARKKRNCSLEGRRLVQMLCVGPSELLNTKYNDAIKRENP